MGYDSVLDIKAKKVVIEDGPYPPKEICGLALLIADSNLWEPASRGRERMVRSWNLVVPDEDWRVMQHVVHLSASCEGGMLKYKGRTVGADTLIRARRKAVKSAVEVESFSEYVPGHPSFSSLEIYLSDKRKEKLGDVELSRIERLIEEGTVTTRREFDGTVFSWPSTREGIASFIENKWAVLSGDTRLLYGTENWPS